MTDPPGPKSADGPRHSPLGVRALVVCSILALVWVLLARALGPSDLWDQTQPKTVGYTTDIIANGRWILPLELGQYPATKPVLYNWMAAPAVSLLGFASEAAHKFPSVLALCLCWLVLVRLGRRLDPSASQRLGWLAGLIFVSNYTIFKLGYLARPDMLLTLWLVLAWLASTALFARAETDPPDGSPTLARRRRGLALAFWLCVGLAALTKGPAALTVVIYGVLAAKLVGGRWVLIRRLRWWWGVPLALAMIGAWAYGVWRINPEHLCRELWFNEIYGRVAGVGPEGTHDGPSALLTGAPDMLLYYVVRFLPWSIASVLAIIALWRRTGGPDRMRRWRSLGLPGPYLHGAAVFAIVVIALYTLSAGKRADYIAAAFAPGSLLAAWWLLCEPPLLARRVWSLAPCIAAVVLALLTVVNQLEPRSPVRGFGDEILAFARRASRQIDSEPLPVEFCWSGCTHLQAVMGYSQPDGTQAVHELVDAGRDCWVVAGTESSPPIDFGTWFSRRRANVQVTPVVTSAALPREHCWQRQVTLYRIGPRPENPSPTP